MDATVAPRRPGRPRSEAVEAAILEAVIDVLIEQGSGLTIEAVAARAGVAKTTVYRRWPGRPELIFDALRRLKGPVVEPPGTNVRDDLVHLLEQMRRSWVNSRNGQVMRRLAADYGNQVEMYRSVRDRLVAPRRATVMSVLRRGVDEGLIRADADLACVLDLLCSPTIAHVMTHREPVSRRSLEFIVDTVLGGLEP